MILTKCLLTEYDAYEMFASITVIVLKRLKAVQRWPCLLSLFRAGVTRRRRIGTSSEDRAAPASSSASPFAIGCSGALRSVASGCRRSVRRRKRYTAPASRLCPYPYVFRFSVDPVAAGLLSLLPCSFRRLPPLFVINYRLLYQLPSIGQHSTLRVSKLTDLLKAAGLTQPS